MKYLLIASLLVLSACGQGPAGPQGLQGVPGNTGPTGPTGAPGANPTVLAFCPDKAGFYAGSYGTEGLQEYYMKIGTQVYAILDSGSATGVYLTLLAPGNYTTSDGSNCQFTVNADGSIIEH